jgi:NAD(P)-dependent dehydrogenase (short-subunit alcohol dehydrogenase family)
MQQELDAGDVSAADVGVLSQFSLRGRVAIVTGASSGLGVQIGRALCEAGADVVLAARRREKLIEVATGLGCGYVVSDISTTEGRATLIEETLASRGAIDILVNNAGIASTKPAETETEEGFRSVLETNLLAPFELARLAGQHMLGRGSGSIINVASVLGMVGNLRIPDAAYSASKGGLVTLTRELAAQWASRGVRVNAVAPGYFESEMTASMFESEKGLSWIARHDPMGRPGRAGELNGAVVFLASDASSYVTGQVLAVDGGWMAV